MSEITVGRIIDLGRGEVWIDRGTYEGVDAVFIEPVSPSGVPGEKGPELPLDSVQQGTNIIRINDQRGADVLAEKLAPRTHGITLIATERKRQIDAEGWSAEHDDGHDECQLLDAALCYAGMAGSQTMDKDGGIEARIGLMEAWPWSPDWWKPSPDPIRNLVKAGALIAAEIDRLQRKG